MPCKKNKNPFRWLPFRRGHNPEYDEELIENTPCWIKKHPKDAGRLDRAGKLKPILTEYEKDMRDQNA